MRNRPEKRYVHRKRAVFLLAITAMLALGGCGSTEKKQEGAKTAGQNGAQVFSKTDFVMDTVLQETLYGKTDVSQTVKDRLSEIETTQLSWREKESEVARLNEKCGKGEKVVMEEKFAGWVKTSMDLAEKSEGTFDPTIGNLTRLWDIEGENPKVPAQKDIDSVLEHVGYTHINIEETTRTISMDAGCTLDLGAVGKGIGCDVARDTLEEQEDITGAVIAVGGSILCYGEKPDGQEWNVAIRDPEGEEGTYAGVLNVQGTSCVSTSGDYEKYFVQDGKKYHHILNPATGYPSESGLSSVTVVVPGDGEWKEYAGLLSDGLSTACFVLGKEKGMKLLKEYGAEGIFIGSDKAVSVTEGIADDFEILNKEYRIGGK